MSWSLLGRRSPRLEARRFASRAFPAELRAILRWRRRARSANRP